MKKAVKKLTLRRETVRHLTDDELRGVAGAGATNGNTCTCTANCTVDTCQDGCTDCCRTTAPCILSCPGTICP